MTPESKARSVAWTYLIVAGAAEVGFTYFLKLSESFTKLDATLAFIGLGAVSFSLLTLAMRRITLGTAYAVWTGIGAFGTAIVGMVFFRDPVTSGRVFFIFLLIAAIVGLKLVG